MQAIVLDGELKSALAAARELSAAGISVIVGSEKRSAMTFTSRAVATTFIYPSPKKDQRLFVDELKKMLNRTKTPPVILSFSDATYTTLAEFADELLPLCRFSLPNAASRERIFNKRATYDLATSLQIPTILEYTLESVTTFPVVVKPKTSVSWQNGEGVFGTAEIVFSKMELQKVYERLKKVTGQTPIIQQFIIGDEFGVELLCDKGEVLLQFAHKRIRSLSPRGGAATVKERLREEGVTKLLTKHAQMLAKAVNWTGPLMVEFKHDKKSGAYLLMETNGRFWGSLPLPLAAGVPFARTYVEMVSGEKLPVTTVSTQVQKTQHFLGDCKWLFLLWFKRDVLRKELYPSRIAGTLSFLRDSICTKKDVWSWSDPMPAFAEILQIVRK